MQIGVVYFVMATKGSSGSLLFFAAAAAIRSFCSSSSCCFSLVLARSDTCNMQLHCIFIWLYIMDVLARHSGRYIVTREWAPYTMSCLSSASSNKEAVQGQGRQPYQ